MRLSGAIIVAVLVFGCVGLTHAAPTIAPGDAPRRMSQLDGKKARLATDAGPVAKRAVRYETNLAAARARSSKGVSVSRDGLAAKLNRFISGRARPALSSSSNSPVIPARQLAANGR